MSVEGEKLVVSNVDGKDFTIRLTRQGIEAARDKTPLVASKGVLLKGGAKEGETWSVEIVGDMDTAAATHTVANDIPVVGVSLFEVAARKLDGRPRPVTVLVPFIRDEFFCCRLTAGGFKTEDISTVAQEEIAALLAEGEVATIGVTSADGLAVADNGHRLEPIEYDCSDLLFLGIEKLESGRQAEKPRLRTREDHRS